MVGRVDSIYPGARAIAGYDAQGNSIYEGMPVRLLNLPVGLFEGGAIYSTISYFILLAAFKRHADHSWDIR